MGDRFVSDGVGTSKADGDGIDGVGASKADGDGIVHGDAEDEDGAARDIDVDGADARGGGGIGNYCRDVGDRSVSDGVGTREADGDGIVHGDAEDENGVACELDVDGAGARGGGGIGNDCSDVGDRSVSDGGIGHGGMFGAFPGEVVSRAYLHSKLGMVTSYALCMPVIASKAANAGLLRQTPL